MTSEPTQENYPIKPELEKTFSTDEVFDTVKEVFSDQEFQIHDGFKITVGRRAGDNISKGFSTDTEKAKIFCPGPLNEVSRTADQVITTVVKSTLTCVRHDLNKSMPETKAKKSDVYATTQDSLALTIIRFSQMTDSSEEEVRLALESLEVNFNQFMTRKEGTDIERMSDSLSGIVHLVHKLKAQFALELPSNK